MVNEKRNDESGRFVSKYDDEAFIEAVQEFGEATTRQVAEHVGAGHDTARRRLTALADDGHVSRRQVAATILWSETDE